MIKKIKGKYVVLSETTGRKFGAYGTEKEAKKRLRQIEFFKHIKGKKAGGKGSKWFSSRLRKWRKGGDR